MNNHEDFSINIRINIVTNVPINKNRNITMNVQKSIVDLIKKERVVSSSEVASFLNVSWNTAEKYLLELIIAGKIEKIKKLGVNLWLLK
jgi:predicted HTH transcriptional regulator